LILRKSLKLLPPDKGGEGRVGERRKEKGRGKRMKGKLGEEDYRAFPQFQICHYTTDVQQIDSVYMALRFE